ncbi:Mobile element protein (plasmid) [Paraburkholderia caribensis]|nr:Mobile element protein [Paraburkholderia caribensis]
MSILPGQYPRYGYRRIQIFLERQGRAMSTDRAWRLWRLALQVPRKRPRRRVSVIALGRSRRRRHDTSGRTTSYSMRAPTANR